MDQNRSSLWKRRLKAALKGLIAAVGLLVTVYIVLGLMAARQVRATRDLWAKAGHPLDVFVAGLPNTKPNATALAIEEAANKLGLERMHRSEPWLSVAAPLAEYLKTELERTGPPVSAPPAAVATFLNGQAPLISKVRAAILDGPLPVWEENNKNLYQTPVPDLLQFISLQKILAADALEALSRGDRAGALQDLEAGWRFGEALNARPELISALITIASMRYPIGVLRRLEGAPPVWRERLRTYAPRMGLSRSYEHEAASMLDLGDEGIYGASPGLAHHLTNYLGHPYVRLCLAGAAERIFEMEKIAEASGPCPDGLSSKMNEVISHIPRWNLLAKMAVPNLYSSWGRAYRLQMDLELTEKVLLAKEARDKNRGVWPETVAGMESSICSNGRWTFTRSPDRVTISYNRSPEFPKVRTSMVLPLRYEEVIPGSH